MFANKIGKDDYQFCTTTVLKVQIFLFPLDILVAILGISLSIKKNLCKVAYHDLSQILQKFDLCALGTFW